jgi:pimeloyl-ACP methyl ester carboxylesterase
MLRVVERGDRTAPPLVLLHGITMDASTWQYQLRDLSDAFRVIATDQRGHGQSTAGTDGYGLTVLARDVAELLAHLDLRDAILLGHSMGAAVVMRLCRDHAPVVGERVRGIVLLSAGPGFDLPPALERAILTSAALGLRTAELLRFRGWYGFGERDVSTALVRLAFGARPSSTHIEWTRQIVAGQDGEAMLRSGFGMADHDGVRAVRSVHTPTMLIVGSHDLLTPPRLARRIHRAFPPGVARLDVVDGPGHQLMLERPDALAALVRSFASSLDAVIEAPARAAR